MQTHTGKQKDDISLSKEFQHHLKKEDIKMVFLIREKILFTERKWTYRQYHIQDNDDVTRNDVIMYCNRNQFPELPFCGPHYKPHETRGLGKHYHLCFDPKVCNGVCTIRRIPYACVACTTMIDKPWISGILSDEKERYKPINNFTILAIIRSIQ